MLTNGVGTFQAVLTQVAGGPYTITATQVSINGTSPHHRYPFSTAAYLTVSNPGGTVITGTTFSVTVQAFDVYNNLATGYTGQIKLTSNDPKVPTLVGNYQFTNTDNGSHVFSNLSLDTGGNRFITATDLNATNPLIMGTSTSHHYPRPGGNVPHADARWLHRHLQQGFYPGGPFPLCLEQYYHGRRPNEGQ